MFGQEKKIRPNFFYFVKVRKSMPLFKQPGREAQELMNALQSTELQRECTDEEG